VAPKRPPAKTEVWQRSGADWLLYRDRRIVGRVIPDANWPNMWRVRRADGSTSDMVNLTRAKDAATAWNRSQ
jgi:hypothetical protein